MRKQILIVIFVIILVTVGFSGCVKPFEENPFSSSVQVSNVNIFTSYFELGQSSRIEISGLRQAPADAFTVGYEIRGNVKNIADKPIQSIGIQVKFLDAPGNVITTATTSVRTLYLQETKTFSITIYNYNVNFFEHIVDYIWEITSVDFHQ